MFGYSRMSTAWAILVLVIGGMSCFNNHGNNVQASSLIEINTPGNGEYNAFLCNGSETRTMLMVSKYTSNWTDAVNRCKTLGMTLLRPTEYHVYNEINTPENGEYNAGNGEYNAFLCNGSETRTMLMVSKYTSNWTDAVNRCKTLKMTLLRPTEYHVYNDFCQHGANGSLWVDGTNDCNDGRECASIHVPYHVTCSVTSDCTTNLRVVCRRNVVEMLRLPGKSGNLEIELNNIWSPLCVNLGLRDGETSQICERQYRDLYTNFSNIYTYIDPATNQDGGNCNLTNLQCPGDPPQNLSMIIYQDGYRENENITHLGDLSQNLPVINYQDDYRENENITLTCWVVGGIPRPAIQWRTQGTDLNSTATWTRRGHELVFSASVDLTLSRDDNNKTFICLVIYENVTIDQSKCTLTVLYPPIADVLEYVEVNETDEVVLQCNVSSNPPSNVTWTGPEGDTVSNETTLTFNDIPRAAIGNYTCRAENSIGQDTNTSVLYINAPPRMFLYKHGFTEQDQTVVIICAASGVPTPGISWYNESELISNTSSKYVIGSVINPSNPYLVFSTLTVFDAGDQDILGHTCSISNTNGKIQKTFRIHRKLKCRCRSRILKNCIPLHLEPEELAEVMVKTIKKLTVNKYQVTSHELKLVSANDDRPSSFAIGVVGVGVLVMLGVVLIGVDLIGHFVINPRSKTGPRTKHSKQTHPRSSIETSFSSCHSQCQSDGDIHLSDVNYSDHESSDIDHQLPIWKASVNNSTTTATVHASPKNPSVYFRPRALRGQMLGPGGEHERGAWTSYV